MTKLNELKLGKIKPGFEMQNGHGGTVKPKRYRLGKSNIERIMFISFKQRGGWFPWKTWSVK